MEKDSRPLFPDSDPFFPTFRTQTPDPVFPSTLFPVPRSGRGRIFLPAEYRPSRRLDVTRYVLAVKSRAMALGHLIRQWFERDRGPPPRDDPDFGRIAYGGDVDADASGRRPIWQSSADAPGVPFPGEPDAV